MHKPTIKSGLKMWGNHMQETFENNSESIIKKWLPIAENLFKDLNFDRFNYSDQKMILFYFEWLANFDEHEPHSILAENVHSFKCLIIDYINSDNANFDIISEVYNPILDRVRYKVKKGNDIVIMDSFNRKDESFFIHIYPNDFLEAIGMKQYLRERKLEDILDVDTK